MRGSGDFPKEVTVKRAEAQEDSWAGGGGVFQVEGTACLKSQK